MRPSVEPSALSGSPCCTTFTSNVPLACCVTSAPLEAASGVGAGDGVWARTAEQTPRPKITQTHAIAIAPTRDRFFMIAPASSIHALVQIRVSAFCSVAQAPALRAALGGEGGAGRSVACSVVGGL